MQMQRLPCVASMCDRRRPCGWRLQPEKMPVRSFPTVNAAFGRLEQAGVLREVTGRKRGRLFAYDAYLSLLQAKL
jgi:hypothetical protein